MKIKEISTGKEVKFLIDFKKLNTTNFEGEPKLAIKNYWKTKYLV